MNKSALEKNNACLRVAQNDHKSGSISAVNQSNFDWVRGSVSPVSNHTLFFFFTSLLGLTLKRNRSFFRSPRPHIRRVWSGHGCYPSQNTHAETQRAWYTSERVRLVIYRTQIRPSDHKIVAVSGQWLDLRTADRASDWVIDTGELLPGLGCNNLFFFHRFSNQMPVLQVDPLHPTLWPSPPRLCYQHQLRMWQMVLYCQLKCAQRFLLICFQAYRAI